MRGSKYLKIYSSGYFVKEIDDKYLLIIRVKKYCEI